MTSAQHLKQTRVIHHFAGKVTTINYMECFLVCLGVVGLVVSFQYFVLRHLVTL